MNIKSYALRIGLKDGLLRPAGQLDMQKRLFATIAEMRRMRDHPAAFERMFW